MKIIRIILLILIIIGLALLATQKIWVPKLVDRIISSETKTNVIHIDNKSTMLAPKANISLVDGRQCYTYNHEATKTEPYKVSEFMDITIKGESVIGTKKGTQSGPDLTNGYTGSIIGTLNKDTITSVLSYTVEGSKGKEKEIYKADKTGIEKLRYPLIEEKGVLVPDITKEFKIMHYSRVGCESAN
ncbi:MAG: hypothetical protein WCI91_00405 [Candidatus Nomurabacteria bacterium]